MHQIQALTAESKRQVKWHPVILWWTLYRIANKGGRRMSGVIGLLTTRTENYRHFGSLYKARLATRTNQAIYQSMCYCWLLRCINLSSKIWCTRNNQFGFQVFEVLFKNMTTHLVLAGFVFFKLCKAVNCLCDGAYLFYSILLTLYSRAAKDQKRGFVCTF